MSGSAGGNRIKRSDVKPTVDHYVKNVLFKYDKFKDYVITGSYNASDKQDFGDIDIVIELNVSDKQQGKKDLAEFLTTFPTSVIVPFRSVKYKGKRFLNTGEIITILYPIVGNKGFVQIDNMLSVSSEETQFKFEFLNLPAIKQGLMLGLIKAIALENPKSVQKFTVAHPLKHNEEFEFNLSSSGLTLRLVELTDDYKVLNRRDIWKSTNWKDVEHILQDYDFNRSFEQILSDIKKNLKNKRSLNRIKGIFKSMVSVKTGEVDTHKGAEKEYALNKVASL